MKKDLVIIARGRPGLGHVTPAVAVAKALESLTVSSCIYSYDQGWKFLSTVEGLDAFELPCISDYLDYPGLYAYDFTSSFLRDILEKHSPRMILLFGEYMLPRISLKTSLPIGLVFNPEIFEQSKNNQFYHPLFIDEFNFCDFLILLSEIKSDSEYFPFPEADIIGSGPFPLYHPTQAAKFNREKKILLIGNGGGLSLPKYTSSYSDSHFNTLSKKWAEECYLYTRSVIQHAIENENIGEICVYSSLLELDNHKLIEEFRGQNEITISDINYQFYVDFSRAHLVISRCGLGFINDTIYHKKPCAVWCLGNHLEQNKIARKYSDEFDFIHWIQSESDIATTLDKLCEIDSIDDAVSESIENERLQILYRNLIGKLGDSLR